MQPEKNWSGQGDCISQFAQKSPSLHLYSQHLFGVTLVPEVFLLIIVSKQARMGWVDSHFILPASATVSLNSI